MLGRRQLRAKSMQALYAYYSGNNDVRLVEKNMLKGVQELESLYFALLNLIVAVKNEAEKKIEIGLSKNFPTAEELNPNYKFTKNLVVKILANHPTLKEFESKNRQLSWQVEEIYPSKIFKEFAESKTYLAYMQTESQDLESDKNLIMHLFQAYIAPNEEVYNFLDDQNIQWSDDYHIACTMVVNTIKLFTEDNHKLLSLVLDPDHITFAQELIRTSVKHEKEIDQIIEEKAINWDLERIALVDKIILQMALAEFLYFTSIPPKVTLNEYVEMAKVYSTPKSKTFVNGLLDKTLKDLQSEGKIVKSARGMM